MPGIPVRGSCRASDLQYDPYLVRILRRIEVRLNGRSVPDVVAYDVERGWIRSIAYRTIFRRKRIDRPEVTNGLASEEVRRGHVSVHWR